ncbi:uncharacterized protein METZ01_LOCUS306084, partial [marine metagenome]|jgi:uncharacterized membrane protein
VVTGGGAAGTGHGSCFQDEQEEGIAMTKEQVARLRRLRSLAAAGAVAITVGLFAAAPSAIALGALVCFGGSFLALIAYLVTLP